MLQSIDVMKNIKTVNNNKDINEIKDIPLFKQAVIQLASGAIAGSIETITMYPLDVIKTRLQLQKKDIGCTQHPKYYHGIIDCVTKMYKQEGILSFSKGIVPPLLIETPRRAVKFFMVEQYLKLFTFYGERTPLTYYLAGMAAGVTEAPFVTPFEVVKVNMQAQSKKNPSTLQVTKHMLKKYGIGITGLYRGLTATILRGGTYSGVYYGFYYSSKYCGPQFDDPHHVLLKDITVGLSGGVLGALVNTPFDVVKSRIQGPQTGSSADIFTFPTMRKIYKREGFRALYKGLLSKTLRLSLGGAILFVTYDRINSYITKLMLEL